MSQLMAETLLLLGSISEVNAALLSVMYLYVPVDLNAAVTLEGVKATKVNCPAVVRLRGSRHTVAAQ